jgi:hypothetical protein
MNCELCNKPGFDKDFEQHYRVLCPICAAEMLNTCWAKTGSHWGPTDPTVINGYYYPLTSMADETVIKMKAERPNCPQCGKEHP